MANRPYFMPCADRTGIIRRDSPNFQWFGGFALSQQRKCIAAHHAAIERAEPGVKVLEISSKSAQPEGVAMSAFNLALTRPEGACSVESVFQASKSFAGGIGPFPELYAHDSREVRDHVKSRGAGRPLAAFAMDGVSWPLVPRTAFYDWVYIHALLERPELGDKLMEYGAFTDIKFNPRKSINCQAAAAALYVSLRKNEKLEHAVRSREAFLELVK